MAARIFSAKRLGFLFTAALLALAGVGVPMNALFFQDSRHPAPLFTQSQSPLKADAGKTETAARIETVKPDVVKPDPVTPEPAVAPTPPSRNAAFESPRADPIAAAIEGPRAPAKSAAAKSAPAKVDAAKTGSVPKDARKAAAPTKKRDPIAALIGGPAPKDDAPQSSVLAAQRALLKLGYVVRANGVMSAATRQAIEKFERDNDLAPTGKVTPNLLRKLSASRGVAQQ